MNNVLKLAFICFLVFLIVSGCSSNSNQTGNESASSARDSGSQQSEVQTIELDFPSWQAQEPGFEDWWNGLIDEFNSMHSHVTIKFTSVPFKNYVDTLLTRFAANNPPDIVHLPSASMLQFASNGWLEPLDDLLKDTEVPKNWTSLQENMLFNGETQGVLLLGYGFNLYYNEKMLTDAGLDVPTTPEQLIEAARKLTKDDVFGFGLTTIEMANVFNEVSMFIVGQGNHWIKDGEYNLTDPLVVKAVDDYRTLLKMSPQGISVEQKRQLFFDGKIAMIIDGPFIYNQAVSPDNAVAPYVKVAPPPFEVIPGNVSNNLSMPRNISDEKKELVGEFIKLATTPKWQAKYAEYTNSPVPLKGAVSEKFLNEHPEMRVFNELAAKAVSIIPESQNIRANFNQFSKMVQSAMMELMITDRPTEEVLANLQESLEQTIQP